MAGGVRAFLCNWMFMVGDCYTQSVMMSDLSNAVAPRLDFLHAPFNSLLDQQA